VILFEVIAMMLMLHTTCMQARAGGSAAQEGHVRS
jgi:hypothetical protein